LIINTGSEILSEYLIIFVEYFRVFPYNNKKTQEVIVVEKKKSYTELTKACAMTRQTSKERSVLEIYVDMVIHESLLTTKRNEILEQINTSLDEQDKSKFMELTDELKELQVGYGL
jgi:uncharacterized protein YpiB (UPF0302 family)